MKQRLVCCHSNAWTRETLEHCMHVSLSMKATVVIKFSVSKRVKGPECHNGRQDECELSRLSGPRIFERCKSNLKKLSVLYLDVEHTGRDSKDY